ncbi:MAG: PDZ domain-containing protein [Myxococcota bacterium]
MLRIALLVLLASCAYPRRSTPLSPVQQNVSGAPGNVVRIEFQGADIPGRDRGGQPWDDDDSGPDVLLRVIRGDTTIYESSVQQDTLTPSFGAPSDNLYLPSAANVRIELWESDGRLRETIIGSWRGRGMPPGALVGADARLILEGNATLAFRVLPPQAQRGTGIPEYEVRGDVLRVLEVIRFSPAGRADLRAGDEILAIDDQSIQQLGDRAFGALSMAGSRRSRIRFRRGTDEREAVLDGGFVWDAR